MTPEEIAKTKDGLFKGLYTSKKFGITGIWVAFCGIIVDTTAGVAPSVAIAALAGGTLAIMAYTIFQSTVEAAATEAVSKPPVVVNSLPTVASTTIAK
jgi:hypothetical protein